MGQFSADREPTKVDPARPAPSRVVAASTAETALSAAASFCRKDQAARPRRPRGGHPGREITAAISRLRRNFKTVPIAGENIRGTQLHGDDRSDARLPGRRQRRRLRPHAHDAADGATDRRPVRLRPAHAQDRRRDRRGRGECASRPHPLTETASRSPRSAAERQDRTAARRQAARPAGHRHQERHRHLAANLRTTRPARHLRLATTRRQADPAAHDRPRQLLRRLQPRRAAGPRHLLPAAFACRSSTSWSTPTAAAC